MSTSDQQGHGPLTRKQLREARQTGATPVITDEMAAAAQGADGAAAQEPDAAVAAQESDAAVAAQESDTAVTTQEPDAQPESIEAGDAALAGDEESSTAASAPLTRRQAREQERIRTASVPVIDATEQEQPAVVSEVPTFAPATTGPTAAGDTTDRGDDIDDDDDDDDDEQLVATPVSASDAAAASRETPVEAVIVDEPATADDDAVTGDAASGDNVEDDTDDVVEVLGLEATDTDDLVDADDHEEPLADGETPVVNSAFGEAVLQQERPAFTPSFDDLIASGDSNGSHTAPSALIFTPSPGEGSLSGPVASTGEILVTGSYELPRGLGSQGHAHGVADGKEVDAVLIDGELPPASSPTPIAASSAVSTIKPAGEIIRPPAPEKGNRLMLVLAIVAGGLALALAVALGVAFTTNVF